MTIGYKLTPSGVAKTDSNKNGILHISRPKDGGPTRATWQDYLDWLEEGNTVEPEFTEEQIEQKRVSDNIEKAFEAIALTDKTQLLDYRTAEDRARWADYRVIILNIINGNILTGQWPTKPFARLGLPEGSL